MREGPPRPRRAWTEVLDHLGLVAGLCDGRGMGDVLDRGLQHPPETRLVPVGSAVNALVLKGLGCVTPQRALGPRCFQHTPPPRLMAPGVEAQPLHADTRGRPGDRREADGVTALARLMAATAAPRRGLAPTVARLDRPRLHGDGRDHRAAEPEAEGMHRTRGASRDHRPARNQVMLDRMVEPQAGRPRLRQPLSGHRRAGQDVGPVVTAPIQPRQTTHGTTDLVADSALYRAETLQQLGDPGSRWITRVPAPVTEAQEALAQAPPHPLAPLVADDRAQGLAATDGGVPPRGILDSSAHRRPQAQRHVDQHWLQQREAAAKAFQQLCRMACAWAAEAQPALTTVAHGLQAASGHEGPSSSRPRDGTRGRPGPDTHLARWGPS